LFTSVITILAINGKYFHNQYECSITVATPVVYEEKIGEESKLVSKIKNRYGVSESRAYELVGVVSSYTNRYDFPDAKTTLAIIAQESNFNPKASGPSGAKGYMQVQSSSGRSSTHEIYQNIAGGVGILREYYLKLGSRDASIQAYNVGIGAYISGKRSPEYLEKIKKNLRILSSV
jgi:hypothetical protein